MPILSSARAFNLDQSKILLFGKELRKVGIACVDTFFNPFQNKHWILHVYWASLLKTLWEKENCP